MQWAAEADLAKMRGAMDWVVALLLVSAFIAVLVITEAAVTKDAPWLRES
jgi:hypothetical protein